MLRAWRTGGYTLPQHFVEEDIDQIVQEHFAGDRARMVEELKRTHVTMDDFRKFTAEELKIEAMRKYVTVHGKYGEAPIPETKWLASLRKGSRIQMIK
jgi:hypothetical protein